MFLIVGLGNPGSEYNKTRHNVGFDVIDLISNKYNIPLNRKKFKGVYGNGVINNKKVILLKPETYMNLSGESVREVVDFYKISIENIIIVQDDISMELGKIRIRQKGSAGGHNGIKNIIEHLNTDKFTRIKIGVGEPKGDVVNYVLGKFSKEEMQTLEKTIDVSADAIDCIIKEGAYEAMNKFNGIVI